MSFESWFADCCSHKGLDQSRQLHCLAGMVQEMQLEVMLMRCRIFYRFYMEWRVGINCTSSDANKR